MSAHENLRREGQVRTSSDRAFGIVFAAVFGLVGVVPAVRGGSPRLWALGLATAMLSAALLAPGLLKPANRLWTRLGFLLHRIVNPVITGIMFYLVFTPMGLLLRLLGKDLLRLRFDPQASTYWLERRPPGPPGDSMINQF